MCGGLLETRSIEQGTLLLLNYAIPLLLIGSIIGGAILFNIHAGSWSFDYETSTQRRHTSHGYSAQHPRNIGTQ